MLSTTYTFGLSAPQELYLASVVKNFDIKFYFQKIWIVRSSTLITDNINKALVCFGTWCRGTALISEAKGLTLQFPMHHWGMRLFLTPQFLKKKIAIHKFRSIYRILGE